MLEYNFDGKNIFNPIDNRMQEVIDTFVEFYGEENRNHISSQLNNAKIFFLGQVGYYGKNALSKTIECCFLNKQNEIIKKLLNKNNITDIDPLQFNYSLSTFNVYGTNDKYDVTTLMEGLGFFKQAKTLEEKDEIYQDIMHDSQAYGRFIEKVYKLKKAQQQIDDKKNKTISKLPLYLKSISSFNDLKNQYNNNIKQLLIDYGKNHNLKLNTNIQLFELENTIDAILSKNPFRYVNLNNVKNLLDFLGIEYERNDKDYEKILKNEKLKNILSDQDFYENFNRLKIERYTKEIENNVFFKDFIDNLIKNNNLYNVNKIVDSVVNFIFSNSNAGYVQMVSEGEKSYNLCVLPQAFDLNDALLLHEFTHIVETDFYRDENGELNYKVGFIEATLKETKENYDVKEMVKNKLQNSIEDDNEENQIDEDEINTYFNEVVTDYLACKIYNIFREKNRPIGLREGQFLSSYSLAFPLIQGFLEDNLEEIKACRISSDSNAFRKLIGEDCYRKIAINLYKFKQIINKNNFSNMDILKNIARKTNLDINNLYDCFKYDCNWTEDEKTIINICKEIDEVEKIVKLRKKFDQDTKNKRNSNKDSLNHIER